jgi:hypothetical protein
MAVPNPIAGKERGETREIQYRAFLTATQTRKPMTYKRCNHGAAKAVRDLCPHSAVSLPGLLRHHQDLFLLNGDDIAKLLGRPKIYGRAGQLGILRLKAAWTPSTPSRRRTQTHDLVPYAHGG